MNITELYISLVENINHIQKYHNPQKYFLGGIGTMILVTLGIVFLYIELLIGVLLLAISIILINHFLRYFIFLSFVTKISFYNPKIFKSKIEEVDILLEQIQNIYSITKYLKSLTPPSLIDNNLPKIIIKEELEFILLRLAEIKIELLGSMKQNIKNLTHSKEEISNIRVNTDLGKVSDLQSSRLDHQIKQFEELQKVLVKL